MEDIYLLGVDVGTSSIKVMVIDQNAGIGFLRQHRDFLYRVVSIICFCSTAQPDGAF